MWWWWMACAGPDLPDLDTVTLRSDGVLAVVEPARSSSWGGGVRVGMWGPSWTTGDRVTASAEQTDGVTWLHFPIQTGLGEGMMVLRLQGDDATVPFGARPGEFELTLAPSPGTPDPDEITAARSAASAGVAREAEAWRRGAFLLRDGTRTVGEVRFQGEGGPPLVSVHDLSWLTPEPAVARRLDDGGDLLLQFPFEPTLESEEALLRINLLSRQAVVPSGPVPDPSLDRRLLLVPGALSDTGREAAVASAVAEADTAEGALLDEQLPMLLRAARSAGCPTLAELGEPWTLVFKGYDVDIVASSAGCRVRLVPELEQHRRRLTRELGD
jgi:hypothetical protein